MADEINLRSSQDVEAVLPTIQPRVRCVCFAQGLPPADADDVWQEVVLALLLEAREPSGISFPSEGHLKKWSAVVAARTIFCRGRGRPQSSEGVDFSLVPAREEPGDAEFTLVEYLEKLHNAQEQECLRLYFAEGLNYQDIAARLEIALGKAHRLLQSALGKLSRRLKR